MEVVVVGFPIRACSGCRDVSRLRVCNIVRKVVSSTPDFPRHEAAPIVPNSVFFYPKGAVSGNHHQRPLYDQPGQRGLEEAALGDGGPALAAHALVRCRAQRRDLHECPVRDVQGQAGGEEEVWEIDV